MFYSYVVVTDCEKDSVVLQESETVDYKWVDKKGLFEYVDSNLAIKTHNDRYKEFFEKLGYVKNLR